MLEIKNLSVEASDSRKKILDNVNLKLKAGKIYALTGRNGSGKSTLANAVMGNGKYSVAKGKIFLNGEDISELSADERARKGIFISFQFSPEILGISFSNFLRAARNSVSEKKFSFLESKRFIEKKAETLGIKKELLEREVNRGFSGGEKRKLEILQMLALNPKIAILDEVDSGLDKESLRKILDEIKKFSSKEKAILIITHNEKTIGYLNPDKVFVMNHGAVENGSE
ncbi:MAG: FeS assembly ATPase SufC [Parcubacteria group bacterium GW2011_GWF1_45_5]|nr:MAG: FeS assembly ATPase SufC [Parcubacteria group bacterium GW2011_GWF1_45_5]